MLGLGGPSPRHVAPSVVIQGVASRAYRDQPPWIAQSECAMPLPERSPASSPVIQASPSRLYRDLAPSITLAPASAAGRQRGRGAESAARMTTAGREPTEARATPAAYAARSSVTTESGSEVIRLGVSCWTS